MKRDTDKLNLRNAFAPEPDSCHTSLMNAACSVKEDEPVKKVSFRVVLIAAAIVIASMAAAVAAGSLLGWSDFFGDLYGRYDIRVPETAERIMNADGNKHTFTLGNVNFTTQQLFCDGHIAMASTEISMADGSDALLCAEPFDAVGAMGENGKKMAARLGVDPETTWIEAAKKLNRKPYNVRAILEMPEEISGGCEMEDMLWAENGNPVYFSMPQLNGKASGKEVDVTLFLRAAEVDLETGESKDVLKTREAISIPLEAPLGEHTYTPENDFTANGYHLEGVRAELSPAGLYLFTTFTAPADVDKEKVQALDYPVWLDAKGEPLPMGINLTQGADLDSWPTLVYMQMFSVDEIPAQMILQFPDAAYKAADGTTPGYQQLTLNK